MVAARPLFLETDEQSDASISPYHITHPRSSFTRSTSSDISFQPTSPFLRAVASIEKLSQELNDYNALSELLYKDAKNRKDAFHINMNKLFYETELTSQSRFSNRFIEKETSAAGFEQIRAHLQQDTSHILDDSKLQFPAFPTRMLKVRLVKKGAIKPVLSGKGEPTVYED